MFTEKQWIFLTIFILLPLGCVIIGATLAFGF